jgi:arylsulfatase A-like enzyme
VDNSAPDKMYGSVVNRKRAYREMVEAMDASVGRIVERVRDLGLEENTFFFFTSDNGGHELVCDNEPLNGAKGSMLEGGHRVPAVACWPGTIAPRPAVADTVILSDLFATVLGVAGIDPPDKAKTYGPYLRPRPLDSTNLLPLLAQAETLPERLLFWRQGEQFAVRDGPWKYVVHHSGQGLFNLDEDIGETRDLCSSYPERVATMRRAFECWSQTMDADGRASRENDPALQVR